MIIYIDPREVRSSWAPWGIPTSESTSLRRGGPDSIASGSANPGGVNGNYLCESAITPELMAPSGSEASSGQLGYVGWLHTPSGTLVHHPVAQPPLQGLGKSQAPPLQPPTWRHLTGHLSQEEAQDTCECPEMCCRVFLGEPPIVWHTTGGPGPVPPSHCTSPLGCP